MAEDDTIKVGNEFAVVHIRKVQTRNGERLEIHTPRLGYRIELDATELESLTWQPKVTFSRFLETPYGPGHPSVPDPLDSLLDTERWS